MLDLPLLYPITDTRLSGLSHLEQVRRMIDGGATFIQLRDKHAAPREFCRTALEAIEYARPRGVSIIINDRVDIALAAGADGVHLGQDDLPPAAAREILGPDAVIGYSTHSLEQALSATALPIDYVALGPVFATQTKEQAAPIVGLEAITQLRSLATGMPLVAIGGIDRANIASVIDAGADSAAVIGDLLREPSTISKSVADLLTACRLNILKN